MRSLFISTLLGVVSLATAQVQAQTTDQDFTTLDKGRYLAIVGDCVACHTKPGGLPFAGGLEMQTPFGIIVSPNITPDRETGIGRWSEDDFIKTMQHGVAPGGKRLYPAFPYPYYTLTSKADLSAIWAYLNTLEPVNNRVESNQLPFPFNIRTSLIGWNILSFRSGEFKSRADKTQEWNRGAYLVDGLGHCGACHTPKTLWGGDKSAKLEGGVLLGWTAPNITAADKQGLDLWTVDDIAAYLKTGTNRLSIASGPMKEVIENSTSKMSDQDLKAIGVYLKDVAGAPDLTKPLAETDAKVRVGKAIYQDNCAACHTFSGQGIAELFPPLKGSSLVQQQHADTLIRITLEGTKGSVTDARPTGPAMPPFGWRLNDDQVAAVLTYIRNSWGNASPEVSASSVRAARADMQP